MKNFKKTMSVLLAAIMSFSAFSALPITSTAAEVDGKANMGAEQNTAVNGENEFSYRVLEGNTAEIIAYVGNGTKLVIPSEIDGYKIIKIANFAFCAMMNPKYYSLTSVEITDGITSIGQGAFSGCSNLSCISVPNSVTEIGDNAFENTDWYNNLDDGVVYAGNIVYKYKGEMPKNTSIEIKDGVTSISARTFINCENLVNIAIPNSVKYIGDGAFSGCCNLINITIPNSVTSIGVSAFYGCNGITMITIPDGVTSIGDYAFCDCINLASINVPDSIANVGACAFFGTEWYDNQNDGIVYINNVAYNYKGNVPENTSLTLKDSTTVIADEAFSACENLIGMTIPYGVTNIGKSAFSGCTNLVNVNIPDSVKTIGEEAFRGCRLAFTNIALSNNIKSIGAYAFCGCTNLISITIPNSITTIENSTFSGCTNIIDIVIPDSVTVIGSSAFYDCTNITNVTIPNSVISIFDGAFANCSSLKSITIPDSVTEIGYHALGYLSYYDEEAGYVEKTVDDFTIKGFKDSAAEEYANENRIVFIEMGETIGDLSGNGVIDINDATIIQKFGVGINTPEVGSALFKCADVNGDGRISILDVTCVQKYLVGGYKDTGLLGK